MDDFTHRLHITRTGLVVVTVGAAALYAAKRFLIDPRWSPLSELPGPNRSHQPMILDVLRGDAFDSCGSTIKWRLAPFLPVCGHCYLRVTDLQYNIRRIPRWLRLIRRRCGIYSRTRISSLKPQRSISCWWPFLAQVRFRSCLLSLLTRTPH